MQKPRSYSRGCGNLSGTFYSRIRKNARDRGLAFEVTPQYLWELFEKQNKRCAYTGKPLKMVRKLVNGRFNYRANTASLDRIDSSLGYVEGNLQWVTKPINFLKATHSHVEFLRLCRAVAYHNS